MLKKEPWPVERYVSAAINLPRSELAQHLTQLGKTLDEEENRRATGAMVLAAALIIGNIT